MIIGATKRYGNMARHTPDKVVEVEHLKIAFGSQQVLKDLTLNLFRGENLVVLGKSGSGKSVLIKCIVGLLIPDSGRIQVLNYEFDKIRKAELEKLRMKIGFLFQSGALYDSMTVKENLEFPLRRIRTDLTETQIKEKVAEVLDNVGLPDTLNKMPSQLSGGMRKRIGLARTIIVDPEIMLYDEPTTGLDPITSDEISLLINAVQEKYKTSSIVITHDMECVRAVADRIVMVDDGQVYKEGTLQEFEQSDDSVIKSYFK